MSFPSSNILTVGAIASKIFEKSCGKSAYLNLFIHWSEIIGENLAAICAPQKVTFQGNHRLLVLKTKKGRSLEVQHESEKILHAINKFLESDFFDNLVIFQMDVNEELR